MENLPEQEVFIEQVAASLRRRGLQAPALLALEAGQPLTFIGGQLLWVAQPALSLFTSTTWMRQLALLLEEPTAVQKLMTKLEAEKANKV